jgi:hypothetical protein
MTNERRLIEHIRALRFCIDEEMQEPLRSTLHEVCRILEAVCSPNTQAAALSSLYAMQAEKETAKLGEN